MEGKLFNPESMLKMFIRATIVYYCLLLQRCISFTEPNETNEMELLKLSPPLRKVHPIVRKRTPWGILNVRYTLL